MTSTILLPDFPPYSTRYGDGAMFREQDDLADIAGFYKAFGVGVDPGRKERPDHLSVELEFLALLCFKERIALAEEDPEKTEVTVEAERRFLRDYVGPFLFSVVEGLRARSAPPIFLAWASVLHELLLVEHARLFLPVPETVRARIPATGMEYGPMACLGDIA
ncbi:MAG: molecular chaperone TorD family protein [Acidobacteriota bacterium]